MRHRRLLLVTLVLLGCGGKKEEAVATGSGAQVGSQVAAPVTKGVELLVGESVVATIDAAKVEAWPRLDSLVPEDARRLGMWQGISITKADGTTADLQKPFETYRDYVPALFPHDGGVSFGMFDPVELGKRGKPALREDKIQRLVVKLADAASRGGDHQGGGEAVDPAKLKLVIVSATGKVELTGEKLLGIEREAMPGGGGDAKGWKLQTILAAADIKTFKKATLIGQAGNSVPIEAKDLDDATIPFIKLNRQGSLRFRVYKKQGEGWQPGADLRSVTEIRVE